MYLAGFCGDNWAAEGPPQAAGLPRRAVYWLTALFIMIAGDFVWVFRNGKPARKRNSGRRSSTPLRDLFVELGYEAVSMRKIAEKIEYSPTTIYLYFRDKSDLLDCICSDTFEQLVERLGSISHEESDPFEALKKGLRAYIDFGLQHPAHYKVAFMMPHAHHCDPERPSRSDSAGERAFGAFFRQWRRVPRPE